MAELSEFDRENMTEIMRGHGDWFSARLLRFLARADYVERRRLATIYPDHVAAYEEWLRDGDDGGTVRVTTVERWIDPYADGNIRHGRRCSARKNNLQCMNPTDVEHDRHRWTSSTDGRSLSWKHEESDPMYPA